MKLQNELYRFLRNLARKHYKLLVYMENEVGKELWEKENEIIFLKCNQRKKRKNKKEEKLVMVLLKVYYDLKFLWEILEYVDFLIKGVKRNEKSKIRKSRSKKKSTSQK